MSENASELETLREQVATRAFIDEALISLFAPEDQALREAREAPSQHNMPSIEISPLQGRMLQVLALACGARKILEIGSLAGYSGIWLARSLPPAGKLISLEISPEHAQVARASLERAGVGDRVEIRVGDGRAASSRTRIRGAVRSRLYRRRQGRLSHLSRLGSQAHTSRQRHRRR